MSDAFVKSNVRDSNTNATKRRREAISIAMKLPRGMARRGGSKLPEKLAQVITALDEGKSKPKVVKILHADIDLPEKFCPSVLSEMPVKKSYEPGFRTKKPK